MALPVGGAFFWLGLIFHAKTLRRKVFFVDLRDKPIKNLAMKRLIFLFITQVIFSTVIAQEKSFEYSKVIEVDSVSKTELYNMANEWFAKTYNSANDVIQLNDKELCKIIGKGRIQSYYKSLGTVHKTGYLSYTFSFEAKDGRYRYEISEIIHKFDGNSNGGGYLTNDQPECGKMMMTTKQWEYIKQMAKLDLDALVYSLEQSLLNKGEKDSW